MDDSLQLMRDTGVALRREMLERGANDKQIKASAPGWCAAPDPTRRVHHGRPVGGSHGHRASPPVLRGGAAGDARPGGAHPHVCPDRPWHQRLGRRPVIGPRHQAGRRLWSHVCGHPPSRGHGGRGRRGADGVRPAGHDAAPCRGRACLDLIGRVRVWSRPITPSTRSASASTSCAPSTSACCTGPACGRCSSSCGWPTGERSHWGRRARGTCAGAVACPRRCCSTRCTTRGGRLVGRTDFAWPEYGLLGEFDGRGKYLRNLKQGQSVADVVMAEKAREDRSARSRAGVRPDHMARARHYEETAQRIRRQLLRAA